jgi:PAS domain S-box-containing protein
MFEPRSPATAAHHDHDVLRDIVEGTACSTGEEFFQALVRHLAAAVGVPFAAVSEFAEVNTRVHTLAFWSGDRIADNFEYDLPGTPCEEVMRGRLCHYPARVRALFPAARPLVALGIEGYLGSPLLDSEGQPLGLLAVFDERPMFAQSRHLYVLRIFAARASAELQRLRAERRLRDSERRYRDLYEEAPVGYLSLGADGRILHVNYRAAQLTGYCAAELEGMSAVSLFADTLATRARDAESFRRFLAGEDLSGLEVEMRRKDGRPLWVSLWMKPVRGADGKVQTSRAIWVDITDRILAENERARLQQQNHYLQEEIKEAHNFDELVGHSAALQGVLEKVRSVAPTDASVLITGETGTGKELIARAIHSASKRRDRPLIKVSCAAFPSGLIESELFGHEKGAFTGAIARRCGRFELANGGTIFLDEIGEIPLETQIKLLRVLQERELERLGGRSPIKVDLRVLAATNRDLLRAVQEKTFREDLYYRLNVFPVALPSVRERREDIPLLVRFLVNKFATRIGKHITDVSAATMQRLLDYSWPGNVRELENVIERTVILTAGNTLCLGADLLPARAAAPGPGPLTLQELERGHMLTVLQQTRWVVEGPSGAARILGLHPNTMRNRMKKLGLQRSAHPAR